MVKNVSSYSSIRQRRSKAMHAVRLRFLISTSLVENIFCIKSFFFKKKIVYLQHPMIKGL